MDAAISNLLIDMLKADSTHAVEMLHKLPKGILSKEEIRNKWKEDNILKIVKEKIYEKVKTGEK